MANETNNDWPIPAYIERARLVTTWQKARFVPRDAEHYRRSPSGELVTEMPEVIPAGWDHEQCVLCMTKIAQLPGCQREGYSNDGGSLWLCLACYEQYVSRSQKTE
ncbi:MAG TPA: hypothetical protein VMO80_16625 [Terriglobales bacterium]|jgi:hypothetical protein|nr:hypothetical protein [Terriglobales bacterium]